MIVVALPDILVFEWDEGNEQKNWLKHQVKTDEAEEPFFAPDYLVLEDEPHSSKQETRSILIGKTKQGRLLFIVFTRRAEKIRIISARDADKKEVLLYEKALSAAKV